MTGLDTTNRSRKGTEISSLRRHISYANLPLRASTRRERSAETQCRSLFFRSARDSAATASALDGFTALRRATLAAIIGAVVTGVVMVSPSVASASTFPTVDAGLYSTCGVKSDATLACWGHDFGEAAPPAGGFKSVSTSRYTSCGVESDATLACWGNLEGSEPAGTFESVSVGVLHVCGVKSDATVACWGDNSDGQASPPAADFKSVSAGLWHTCGVRSDATVACWGDNSHGQASPPAADFKSVSAGSWHTCGVRSDATVACWGDNSDGQATPPAADFRSVSAADGGHTCGVKSDWTVACWGDNSHGQATPPGGDFRSVSAGYLHTCGVKSDATVVCWGDNVEAGQTTVPADAFPYTPNADLSVSVAAPASVRTKWSMNYAITVANDGSTSALNVVLTDELPSGTTFQDATVPAGWTCTFPPKGRGGLIRCTVPSMAKATTASSSLFVKVKAGPNKGPLVNQAQVTSDTFDFDLSNNSSTVTTTVTR